MWQNVWWYRCTCLFFSCPTLSVVPFSFLSFLSSSYFLILAFSHTHINIYFSTFHLYPIVSALAQCPMNPSFSTHNKGSSSVRESILSTTTRPVSRKWKQLVSKLKWFNKRQQPDSRPKSTGQAFTSARSISRRRHSSDELARTNEYPYYTAQKGKSKIPYHPWRD